MNIEAFIDIFAVFFARFLKFSKALASSLKCPVRTFFHKLKRDCSSTTGSNLRRIMQLVGKDDINNIHINDINSIEFCSVRNGDEWRVMFINELLDARSKQVIIDNFDNDEISNILDLRSNILDHVIAR